VHQIISVGIAASETDAVARRPERKKVTQCTPRSAPIPSSFQTSVRGRRSGLRRTPDNTRNPSAASAVRHTTMSSAGIEINFPSTAVKAQARMTRWRMSSGGTESRGVKTGSSRRK